MKKLALMMGMLVLIAALFCVSALAAEGVAPASLQNAKLLDAAGTEVADVDADGIYEGVAQIELTIPSTDLGTYELIYLVKGDAATAPTESNLFYIDQTAGTGAAVTVTLYPKDLELGSYTVMRVNSNGVSEAAMSFEYKEVTAPAPTYKLGDPDNNGTITANDASVILQYCVANAVKKPTIIPVELQPAADTDLNGTITANDASIILQYCVASPEVKPTIIPD